MKALLLPLELQTVHNTAVPERWPDCHYWIYYKTYSKDRLGRWHRDWGGGQVISLDEVKVGHHTLKYLKKRVFECRCCSPKWHAATQIQPLCTCCLLLLQASHHRNRNATNSTVHLSPQRLRSEKQTGTVWCQGPHSTHMEEQRHTQAVFEPVSYRGNSALYSVLTFL